MSKLDSYSSRSHFLKLPLTNMVATSDSCNRNYSAILATLQITSYVDINRQTSGESASLPQYIGCNTVFDMRLRVTFLRRRPYHFNQTLRTANKF